MAAATDILAAVKSALVTAYPTIPIRTSKRKAANGKQLEGGLQSGLPLPCFVISCAEAEDVDALATFEHVSVAYRVVIEYVKSAQAAVTGAADAGASTVVEDPDVRDKREAIRTALYKTLAGVAGVFDVRTKALPVYESTGEGRALVLVSGEEFTFSTMVPRPGA